MSQHPLVTAPSSKGYVFEDNRRVLTVSSSKRGLCEDKCRVLPIPSSKHSLFEDNCKSVLCSLDKFLATPDYHIQNALVLDNKREIRQDGKTTYLPVYYIMFLQP